MNGIAFILGSLIWFSNKTSSYGLPSLCFLSFTI